MNLIPRPPQRGRPHGRPRLLAAAAAPLALAGIALVPAAAATAAPAARDTAAHTAQTTTATTATTATSGQGHQVLSLPGMRARSYTITLITGDQVRLTRTRSGQYTATGIPGTGPATQIDLQSQGNRHTLTSLQATPDEAARLISSGWVNPGLFDLPWLTSHGDAGSTATIPVTLQYPAGRSTAVLRGDAARLPGVTVTAATKATGTVTMTVSAGKAGAFWAALTRQPAAGAPAGLSAAPGAALAGGASLIWATGHQTATAASPKTRDTQSEDSQPMYTVTETLSFPARIGPAFNQCLGNEDYQDGVVFMDARFCPNVGRGILNGVAGAGLDQAFQASSLACVSLQPAAAAGTPAPLCTQWQETYQVPAGIYSAHQTGKFLTTDNPDHELEEADVEMDVPQLTVTGPAAFTMNVGQAVPVTVSTPQPASHGGPTSMAYMRDTEDGHQFGSILEDLTSRGMGNWWAIPTPASERATIGSYTFNPEITETAPAVTAVTGGPAHLNLHPIYPCGDPTSDGFWCAGQMFSGSHILQVVDAGQGTPADFAKIDARGKLVVLHKHNDGCPFPSGCGSYQMEAFQMADAVQAGAAGILYVGTTDPEIPGVYNPIVNMDSLDSNVSYIPFAVVGAAEGQALDGLLAKGPVTVTVTGHGASPYAYFLSPYQEGGIAGSQNYALTAGHSAEVTSNLYTSPLQDGMQVGDATFSPLQFFAVGEYETSAGAQRTREYYGPLSPDTEWSLSIDEPASGILLGGTNEVFGQARSSTLDWNELPVTVGALAPATDLVQAQGVALATLCASCRQGNTFWPYFELVNGPNLTTSSGPVGYLLGTSHLYDQAGQQIPPTPYSYQGVLTFGTYQLPPQQARYKLVVPYQNTTTTWDFTSGEPATDQTPQGTKCVGTDVGASTAPCQANPLVFLNYDAGLSAANTITPGTHQLQVTGYHQDPAAPPVTTLKLWTSTDGGTTWTPATVTAGKNGHFTVTYTIPATAAGGSVSIKSQASDAAGNDITQEIDNAYPITAAAAAASSSGR